MPTRSKSADTAVLQDTPPDDSQSPLPGAASYPIDKPVNLVQLEAEIIDAVGVGTQMSVALTGGADPNNAVGSNNPQTLWVLPSSLDSALVTTAIADHVPDSNWGVPQVVNDFSEVWSQLSVDPEMALDADQQLKLLRGIAFRVMGAVPPQTGP